MFTSSLTDKINEINLIGNKLTCIESVLNYPDDLSKLKMFAVEEPSNPEKVEFTLDEVDCKMVLFKIYELPTDKKEWYAVAMLHNN